MRSVLLFVLLSVFALAAPLQKRVIETGNGGYILSNTIIVKMKESIQTKTSQPVLPAAMFTALQGLGGITTTQLFKTEEKTSVGLEKIYAIEFTNDVNPFTVAESVKASGEVEWAEPRFLYAASVVPNDPSYSSQWNLSKVSAATAWNVTEGDTTVIIGIVDTGVQWDHPDLSGNIWHNWKEIPNNGIDDDGNGYIDDTIGWDFGGLTGTSDNNPTEDAADHGTHVAGIASATTNNGVGIAGLGFKCKIMAVKTAENSVRSSAGEALISFGYEGIVYAVNNGCKVINCSWGGPVFSQYGKQTIDYATSKGVLVVCAAGNSNSNLPSYPANYDGVLCVGATTTSDTRSSYSNYGYRVDVSSPGDNIYSTWMTSTYTNLSGTSMASPLAAGLAGLVKSQFPKYTPQQVAEQIRVTTDNIDNLNSSYTHQLGKGRINASTAVSTANAISLRAYDVQFSDVDYGNGDGVFQQGEAIAVRVKFRNILNSATPYTVTLTAIGSDATIVNGIYTTPSMAMGDSCDNSAAPLKFQISASVAANKTLGFFLTYTNGTYTDYQYISTVANPLYAWQSVYTGMSGAIWGIDYASNDVVWISSDSGYVSKSINGGLTFSKPVFVGSGTYSIVGLSDKIAVVATGPASGNGQILRTTDGGATWTQVYTTSGAWFDIISKTDANNLWALSDPISGKFHIVKSTDAGATWTVCSNLPTAPANTAGLNDAWYQIGSNIWFGIGASSGSNANKVFKSTNGPDGPWTSYTTTQQGSGSMAFSSATGNGLIGFPGVSNYLNKTTNGGTSYSSVTTTIGAVSGLDYIPGTATAYAASNSGLYKTTNNGTAWTQESLPSGVSGTTYFIRLTNSGNNGLVGGASGLLLRKIQSGVPQTITLTSPVGGETWPAGSVQNITWTSTQIATVKIEYSTDNGATWVTVTASVPAEPATFAWTVPATPSAQARIRVSDGSNTATNTISPNTFTILNPNDVKTDGKSYSYALFTNYPNPFNPTTTIRFSLASGSHVSLIIYNSLGQRVATLVNSDMSAGIHEQVWNAGSCASGVYFYELRAGNFTSVKKLLLMK